MGEARTLVVVRHGETDWNRSGRAQGHADIPLNDTGRVQAQAVARLLAGFGPVRLWSSDLVRARQTAEAIAETTGLAMECDSRLREYDVGERSGLTLQEAAERYPEEYAAYRSRRSATLVPGEETTEQVRDRVVPALLSCFSGLGPGQTGIAVLHGACLRVGLMGLIGWPWEQARALQVIENGAFCMLTHDPVQDRVRLTSYNEKVGSGRLGFETARPGPLFVRD
ncbi:MAG TPA: histidine phosphatase family protein [Nocardioides sp.]|nr:histidine phosphatase family protein [Nocardioides sp.]